MIIGHFGIGGTTYDNRPFWYRGTTYDNKPFS